MIYLGLSSKEKAAQAQLDFLQSFNNKGAKGSYSCPRSNGCMQAGMDL